MHEKANMNQAYNQIIDDLIKFHEIKQLLPETLYLAVSIFRRFLSVKQVTDYDELLHIGVTAMFIASKYEESESQEEKEEPINIADFCGIANRKFLKKEIVQKELDILDIVQFDLHYFNPVHFLERLLKEANADKKTCKLSYYLMKISLVDHQLALVCSSYLADTAFYFAHQILDNSWVCYHVSRDL